MKLQLSRVTFFQLRKTALILGLIICPLGGAQAAIISASGKTEEVETTEQESARVLNSAQMVIEEFWSIQDSGAYTKLGPLFSEDALFVDPLYGEFRGREAISKFMVKMEDVMGGRNIYFKVNEIQGENSVAWARWTMYLDDQPSRSGVGIYKVENGLISYYRDYLDIEEDDEKN